MKKLCPLLSYFLIILSFASILSCGDDNSTGPTTDQRTFSGTTRATGPTSCTGDSHTFSAGAGNITATVLSSTNNADLQLQVCAGGIDNGDCTINQTRVFVGQAVSGGRKGGASQTLVLQPINCGPGGGPPPADPINYTVTVVFQR